MKINLSSIGREENIIYELTHKSPKYPEAFIDGDLPPIEQNPPPDWLPPTGKKRSLLGYFNLLLV